MARVSSLLVPAAPDGAEVDAVAIFLPRRRILLPFETDFYVDDLPMTTNDQDVRRVYTKKRQSVASWKKKDDYSGVVVLAAAVHFVQGSAFWRKDSVSLVVVEMGWGLPEDRALAQFAVAADLQKVAHHRH